MTDGHTPDLIERIEGSSALQDDGGYALDGEIAQLLGWTYSYRDGTHRWGWCRPGTTTHFDALPPRYTSSLDAAATLIPEGWSFQVSANPRSAYATVVHKDHEDELDERVYSSGAATPALALCAASLKARAIP